MNEILIEHQFFISFSQNKKISKRDKRFWEERDREGEGEREKTKKSSKKVGEASIKPKKNTMSPKTLKVPNLWSVQRESVKE